MITSIKKITTKPAYNILECDGENLQAKIAASMSGDPALGELFLSGGDFHSNNAYQMMAKYQTFTPYQVTFSDNSTSLIMEWKSFDVERAHHVEVKDLQAGDKIDGKEVVSVKPLDPIKISADEYRKNAKQGRLKDIRTIAKFCFGEGAEVLTSDGWVEISTIAKNPVKDAGLPYSGNYSIIGRDGTTKEIFGTINTEPQPLIDFEFEDGTVLSLTEDHEVVIQEGGTEKQVYARDLYVGAGIINYGDGVTKIVRITRTGKKREAYCLNVEGHLLVVRTKTGAVVVPNCGFGFLFGSAAMTFANGTLRMEWTFKRCEAFIKEYQLEDLKQSLIKRYFNLTNVDIAYLTVASFFRAEFFKMYPVLGEWIEEQGKIAARQGYIRSPWGIRRLLPQLTYQGQHSDRREIKNLSNIAVNSPVQDYEVEYMARAMVGINKDFEEYGLLSYIVGTVHDSVVSFTFIPEQDQILKILLSHFAIDYPAAKGIPYSGECNVAEVSKGEIWGYGSREVKLKDVESVEMKHLDYFK